MLHDARQQVRLHIPDMFSCKFEFTQSPIPINTYLHLINTCRLSANKNSAWHLIEHGGIISMLIEVTQGQGQTLDSST